MTIEAFAPAKLNLALHIVGQRADGYHLLQSLVAFADVGDRLWLRPASDIRISVEGPFAPGVPTDESNLVWQVAQAAGRPCHIRLEKNLPHGAGIGGGSSDAAAILRALGADIDPMTFGADVPVCLHGKACVMEGVGEQIIALRAPLPPLFAVIANPGIHVATPEVFMRLDRKSNPPFDKGEMDLSGQPAFFGWLGRQRNDLEDPAIAAHPEIAEVLAGLARLPHVRLVRMSGSGATCFGLFETESAARDGVRALAQDHPEWWCVAAALS